MTSQQLFTNALRAAMEARGFTLVVDQDFTNTGSFRAVQAGTLSFALHVRYSFQGDYATFDAKSGAGQPLANLPYVKPAELQGALDRLVAFLPVVKKPARRKAAR
jgi:hypothetical protein